MEQRKGSRGAFVLLCLLALAVVTAGCGSSTETMPKTANVVLSSSTPTVSASTCARCHPDKAADWLTTKHANLNTPGNLYSVGSPTLGQIAGGCTKNCHDPLGDSNNLTALIGNVPRPVVGCESCHGPGSLHASAGGAGAISVISDTTGTVLGTAPTVTLSGQFVMCTDCHQLLSSTGSGTVTAAHDAGGSDSSAVSGAAFIITDTHFATAGNWTGIGSANTKSITGYAMNYNDERVCVTCHNPHKPPTQNREWAQSAHADKGAFNLNSTQSGYTSGAWAHYNWSQPSYKACQRCHTTTGFQYYADTLRVGDTALAQTIQAGTHTSRIAASASWKPEMLKCNGCHTDNIGTLRNPGAITATYDYVTGGKTYAKVSHSYPNLAGSNVCMACHTGREAGDTISGLNDPALLSAGTITTFNYANSGFINSHYLTAGGQVFTVTGYHFPGRPYNNIPEYRHDKIGTAATQQLAPYVNTGSNGPCIGCHMSRPNKNGNHIFLPVSRSTTSYGLITGIASEVCFNCHGPSSTLILDLVREQKNQFHESILAFEDLLATRGIYFAPYNPYFFIAPGFDPTYNESTAGVHCALSSNLAVKNWQTGGNSTFAWSGTSCTSVTNTPGMPGTGQNNLGAAFNFNLLEHDPGAYVHNRMYTKRLIYDSMDWLDDNDMNYSVGTTLNALCSGGGAPAYCAEAMTYLLPNGILGIEAERP